MPVAVGGWANLQQEQTDVLALAMGLSGAPVARDVMLRPRMAFARFASTIHPRSLWGDAGGTADRARATLARVTSRFRASEAT